MSTGTTVLPPVAVWYASASACDTDHDSRSSRSTNGYYALDVMESKHYHVSMVKTDVESLCKPHGFAHPLTAACGNVLLADALQLHTVAVGSRLHDVRAFLQPRQPLAAVGVNGGPFEHASHGTTGWPPIYRRR